MNERIMRLLEYTLIRDRVLAQCATPYGEEWARLLGPLADLASVQAAMARTAEGATLYRLKGVPPFARTSDIRPALRRVRVGSVASATELAAVSRTAHRARQMLRFVADIAERSPLPVASALAQICQVPKAIEDEINQCIDEDAVMLDHASSELGRLRAAMRTAQERVKRTLEEMVRSAQWQKYLQDTIVTMRGDRYCLAVRADSQQHVRGVVHDASASGQTLFVEPERVLQLSNELQRLRAQEQDEMERILVSLSEFLALHEEVLRNAVHALGELDFMVAKAIVAHAMNAVEPTLSSDPMVHIRAGRHPLLEPERVVPLDIAVGTDFHLLVITGPNTGGKTVALKTTGLLTLMALSGLFVPALEGSQIGFFSEVYADIGDEQSIAQNLSTFSSHMTQIIDILKKADRASLVLFDELGAGTDPTEGAALAVAILDDLRTRGIRTIATTHYTELKAYAYTTPHTMNASMEFDVATLAPTYRLLMGVPGKSNAFAISRRLGLPEPLIKTAEQQLSTHDVRVEDLIAQLQASVLSARQEEEELAELRAKLTRLEDDMARTRESEEAERVRRQQKAEDEARTLVRRAQHDVEQLLEELREARAHGRTLRDHELTDARKRLEGLAPDRRLQATRTQGRRMQPAVVGDEVRVLTLGGQKGTILELPERGDEVLVAIGAMKVKVSRDQLEMIRSGKAIAAPVVMVTRSAGTEVGASLDLRGTTVDEAMIEVDRYLDRAVLAGFHQVTLIHGKGTGALRKGVLEYLRDHPRIRTSRAGGEGEGGSGVTVVELSR